MLLQNFYVAWDSIGKPQDQLALAAYLAYYN